MFSDVIRKLEKKADKEVEMAKITPDQRNERITQMCEILEKERKKVGLMKAWEEWNATSASAEPEPAAEPEPEPEPQPKPEPKKQSQKKRRNRKTKVVEPEPVADVPDLVKKWADGQASSGNCTAEQAIAFWQKNWDAGVSDYIEDENQRIIDVIMTSQSDVINSMRKAADFQFTVLGVNGTYSFEGEVPVSPGSQMKVKKQVYRNSAWGYIEENGKPKLAILNEWEERDGAELIDTLEPYSVYSGSFNHYKKRGLVNLTLEDGEIDKIGEKEFEHLHDDSGEIIENLKKFDPSDVEFDMMGDDNYKEIAVVGRLMSIGDVKTTKSGKQYLSIRLGTADMEKIIAGDTSALYISVFSDINVIFNFQQNQKVVAYVQLKKGTGDYEGTLSINLRWIAPLEYRPKIEAVN